MVTYIEDPDSLRFALSVADGFDVAALQPHFPGYPVFWGVVKPLYLLTGRFAVAFALTGGLATIALVGAGLALLQTPLRSARGGAWALAVLVCPLVWLMGTRYMPDLLGLAVALSTVACALHAINTRQAVYAVAAGLLAGTLAGLRLSYLPFVLPALLALSLRPKLALSLVGAGLGATGIWLIPLIADTGWAALFAAAQRQTMGHFTEFGGTVLAEDAGLGRRLTQSVESVWADGLGGWWEGRHGLTGWASVGLALALAVGVQTVLRRASEHERVRRTLGWLMLCAMTYGIWMVLYQNVIYKSRHALPLVALTLLVIAVGAASLWTRAGALQRPARVAVMLGSVAVAAVAGTLAMQHRQPTAIAQATEYVRALTAAHPDLHIVTTPLVRYTLAAQGIDATYLDPGADQEQIVTLDSIWVLSIGAPLGDARTGMRAVVEADTFYHNPYVNRMWATLPVYAYPSASTADVTPQGDD